MVSQSAYCLSAVFNFLTIELMNAALCECRFLHLWAVPWKHHKEEFFFIVFAHSCTFIQLQVSQKHNVDQLLNRKDDFFRACWNELKTAADWHSSSSGTNANTARAYIYNLQHGPSCVMWCSVSLVCVTLLSALTEVPDTSQLMPVQYCHRSQRVSPSKQKRNKQNTVTNMHESSLFDLQNFI